MLATDCKQASVRLLSFATIIYRNTVHFHASYGNWVTRFDLNIDTLHPDFLDHREFVDLKTAILSYFSIFSIFQVW